ncbi:TPA: hypothetical protein ACTUT5_003392 [Legionella anisa]|uniref:hypothetical protein n=1 Tax=Legionella anisa TaxID=28082 RepID=UPI001980282D|nr:hypothetical protein [Legionella anisa]MBN5936517.1 hypothetical protein [Legionella anisa]
MAREQLADRKKLRKVRDISLAQGWLDLEKPMPTEEELSLFFKKSRSDNASYLQPYHSMIDIF